MTKVQIKNGTFTPFCGQFFVADKFKRHILPCIDGYLGRRSRLVGYQYSEILLAMMYNFFCGENFCDSTFVGVLCCIELCRQSVYRTRMATVMEAALIRFLKLFVKLKLIISTD